MADIQGELFADEGRMFTKPVKDGKIDFIEREVDRFDFEGFQVVRKEFFSKANCPAVTLKYGSVTFNVKAIRKLDECRFLQILINLEKKLMIAKPCEEDDKDALQCSRIDKQNKVVPRTITGKNFTAMLYKDMNWNIESTIKILGTLVKCRDEKIFVFDLINAETYLHLSEPLPDDPKRRKRVPFLPQHWQGNYGQSYKENTEQMITTFDAPEGFMKVIIPKPSKDSKASDQEEMKPIQKNEPQ